MGLIAKSSLLTKVYRQGAITLSPTKRKQSSYTELKELQAYITPVTGDRRYQAGKAQEIGTHLLMTEDTAPDIKINDIVEQNGIFYRVKQVVPNASNAESHSEYDLEVETSDLSGLIGT